MFLKTCDYVELKFNASTIVVIITLDCIHNFKTSNFAIFFSENLAWPLFESGQRKVEIIRKPLAAFYTYTCILIWVAKPAPPLSRDGLHFL